MKTSNDYAPCVQVHRDGRTRKGNVKEAMLLQPDAAQAVLAERGVVVVYVRLEDAEAVRNGAEQ